jgi:hypothetical protein
MTGEMVSTGPLRRVSLILAAVLAVAIVACVVVVALVRHERGPGRDIGAGVRVSGPGTRTGLKAQVTSAGSLPVAADVMEPVSAYFQIGPSGPLSGSMTVRLPVRQRIAAPDAQSLVTVLTAEAPNGPWAALPTTVDPGGRSVTAVTGHLSFFVAVRTWIGSVVGDTVGRARSVLGAAKTAFDGFTSDVFADAQPPQCADEAAARNGGYTVSTDSQKALLWCFGTQDGKRVLKVVDNRRYPVLIDHPGLSVIDDGPSFQFRLAQLAKAVSGRGTVVFPGETAVFGADLPGTGGTGQVRTQMDGVAQSLYALEVGLRTALEFLTEFGAGSGIAVNGAITDSMPVADMLDAALQDADCAAAVTRADFNLGELMAACFDADSLAAMFGRASAFLAPVLVVAPLIAFFKSELNAFFDQFDGRQYQRVTVTRADTAQLCPAGPARCFGTATGDVDGDGRADTVSLTSGADGYGYDVVVLFASGATGTGSFDLPFNWEDNSTGQVHTPTAAAARFSLQGLADLDGRPGSEIVARAELNHEWYVAALTYAITNDGHDLVSFSFDGAAELDLSLNEPIYGFDADPVVTYGGFRCGRAADSTPQLTMWRVTAYEDGQYRLTEVVQQLNAQRQWEPLPNDVEKVEHGGVSAAKSLAAAQRAKGSCPGLSALPPL